MSGRPTRTNRWTPGSPLLTHRRRVDVRFDGSWHAGAGIQGGRCAAALIDAARDIVGDPRQRPRTLSLLFGGPVEPGHATVVAIGVRRGDTTAVQLEVFQHASSRAVGLARFNRERPTPDDVELIAPSAPPPEACPVGLRDDAGPPFTRLVEYRPVAGRVPSDDGVPGYLSWIRLRDGDPPGPEVTMVLADAAVPAVDVGRGGTAPVATLELTIAFVHDPLDDDPWVLADIRSRATHDGYSLDSARLFDRHGRLLAHGQQLRRFVDPS